MSHSKFRIWARVIAFLENVLWIVECRLLIHSGVNILRCKAAPEPCVISPVKVAAVVFWVVAAVLSGILFWYSHGLYHSAALTAITANPSKALHRAKQWRTCVIVLSVSLLVSLSILHDLQGLVTVFIGIVLNLLFIGIVHRFIKDLEVEVNQEISSPSH